MRSALAVLVAAVALVSLSTASASHTRLSREALVPNAVAFRDRMHGELGTGWEGCTNRAWHCRPQGTISATSDGGKTWHVIRRTRRPVIAITFFHGRYYAMLDTGRFVSGQPGSRHIFKGYCPRRWTSGYSADLVDPTIDRPWSICLGEAGGFGSTAKAIYRGHTRVAYAPLIGKGAYGGIGAGGEAQGIAGAGSGFGIVWEGPGTLFVTRDGGRHWHPRPLAGYGDTFGHWAYVLSGRVGYAILAYGDSEKRRLTETTDAGRTWHVVHRWRCAAKLQRC